jgi:hypothetical protein
MPLLLVEHSPSAECHCRVQQLPCAMLMMKRCCLLLLLVLAACTLLPHHCPRRRAAGSRGTMQAGACMFQK